MSNVKFAHYFNEGAGYLFVASLGAGVQGETMLVRSAVDSKLYVRKRAFSTLSQEHLPAEVRFYRPWPFMPTLIDWVEIVARDGGRRHATVWQFCNGGDLADFIDKYDAEAVANRPELGEWVPPGVIWRFFDQMLRTFAFIQRCLPPVVHRDLNVGNFFLHWPTEDAEIPDFFLGDFGFASTVDLASQGSTTLEGPERPRPKIFSNELKGLADRLVNLMCHTRDLGKSTKLPGETPYSGELKDCIHELGEAAEASEKAGGTVPDLRGLVNKVRAAAAVTSASGASNTNVQATMPVVNTKPKLYDTREQIAQVGQPAGPWHIAAVDVATFQIISVEEESITPVIDNLAEEAQAPEDSVEYSSPPGPKGQREDGVNSSDERHMEEFFAEREG